MAGGPALATVQSSGGAARGQSPGTNRDDGQPEGTTIMRLSTRKLCVLAIGTLAAMAMARYGAEQVPSPPYAAGILQCRSVDSNGLPTGCVPIDPSHFGFAALRGM
ncbi:hypothetical protein BTE28158_00124 [Burkholderia territorii]|nr:hypothetical protein BTE28158_00124 [Burkholderia territorii]